MPEEVSLRRSQWERTAIHDDYVVYLLESDFDVGRNEDSVSFSHAINDPNFSKWVEAMKEEQRNLFQDSE